MENIAGFYKNDSGILMCGPNYVIGPTFELHAEQKDTYAYPVEGWTWYDSLDDACTAYGLNIEDYADQPQPVE